MRLESGTRAREPHVVHVHGHHVEAASGHRQHEARPETVMHPDDDRRRLPPDLEIQHAASDAKTAKSVARPGSRHRSERRQAHRRPLPARVPKALPLASSSAGAASLPTSAPGARRSAAAAASTTACGSTSGGTGSCGARRLSAASALLAAAPDTSGSIPSSTCAGGTDSLSGRSARKTGRGPAIRSAGGTASTSPVHASRRSARCRNAVVLGASGGEASPPSGSSAGIPPSGCCACARNLSSSRAGSRLPAMSCAAAAAQACAPKHHASSAPACRAAREQRSADARHSDQRLVAALRGPRRTRARATRPAPRTTVP